MLMASASSMVERCHFRFKGFDRYYGVHKATAQRDAARAELRSLQLNVTAAVWTAYYDYRSAAIRSVMVSRTSRLSSMRLNPGSL
jgi:outer membrane protein TolC